MDLPRHPFGTGAISFLLSQDSTLLIHRSSVAHPSFHLRCHEKMRFQQDRKIERAGPVAAREKDRRQFPAPRYFGIRVAVQDRTDCQAFRSSLSEFGAFAVNSAPM